MAGNNCFDNFNSMESSSDYINRIRQTTIYNNWACKSFSAGGETNPVKKNGYRYNDNFGITKITNTQEGCLKFAKNYDLLLDITKGNMYAIDSVYNKFDSYQDALSGNFYSVDYSKNNVNVVVDTSYNAGNTNKIIFPIQNADEADISWNGIYPGVIVDPSSNIFYDNCSNKNNKNSWTKLVEIDFQHTNFYKKALESTPLNGFRYPAQVNFPIQSNYLFGPFGYVCCRYPTVRPSYWTSDPATYLLNGANVYYFNITIVNNENGTYGYKPYNTSIDMQVNWAYKIKGTDLGGITPDNDAIITITGVDSSGRITSLTVTGTAPVITPL